jgi:hypothetical protein
MRREVCAFVKKCLDCQRAKPAPDSWSGLHGVEVVIRTMERVFTDSVGPILSRKGNIAVLVVLDGFSKFVAIYPVRRISSEVVETCMVEMYFPAFSVSQYIVSDNAAAFTYHWCMCELRKFQK